MGIFSINDNLNTALINNPPLMNTPSVIPAVANASSPNIAAQTISHAVNMVGVQQAARNFAIQNPNPTHWYDGVVHAASSAANTLNKPLGEIQKDYKYIHSIYTRNGILDGAMATLAVGAGAGLGFLVGGGFGAVAGADLAAYGLRKITGNLDQFKNSYSDSENPNYQVSMGRDVANSLGAHGNTNSGWGKFVSGSIDAGFDVGLDPLMKLGALNKAVKAGKFISTEEKIAPVLLRNQGIQDFLARNSINPTSAAQMDAIYRAGQTGNIADKFIGTGRKYNNVLSDLLEISSKEGTTLERATGEITVRYPELQGSAAQIAKAKSTDAIHRVILKSMFDAEDVQSLNRGAVAGTFQIPSRSFPRAALSTAAAKMRQPFADTLEDTSFNANNAANFIIPRKVTDTAMLQEHIDVISSQLMEDARANGQELSLETARKQAAAAAPNFSKVIIPLVFNPSKKAFASAIAKKVRTFSGYMPYDIDPETLQLSTKEFDPSSASAGQGMYRSLRISLSDRMAQEHVGAIQQAINSGDISTARGLWLNAQKKMLVASGVPNDSELVSSINSEIDRIGEGNIASRTYGIGHTSGDAVNTVDHGDHVTAEGLTLSDTGKWSYPDYNKVKMAMRGMGNVGKIYGKVDDIVAKSYTNSIFKPLALLTGGFGLRVAASELIPTMIRFGGIDTVAAKAVGSVAKLQMNLAREHVIDASKKLGYELAPNETDHILANAMAALSGNHTNYTAITHELTPGEQLNKQITGEAISAGTAQKFLESSVSKVQGATGRKFVAKSLSKVASLDDLRLASLLAMDTNGHLTTGATRAGHGLDVDAETAFSQQIHILGQRIPDRRVTNKKDFRYYNANDDHYDLHWANNINRAGKQEPYKNIMNDVFAELKKGKSQDDAWATATKMEEARIRGVEYNPSNPATNFGSKLSAENDKYALERTQLSRYKSQNPEQFAFARADNLRNMVTGADGMFHSDVAARIATGQETTLRSLMQKSPTSKPAMLHGPDTSEYIGPNIINRITQNGFTKVLDPIINDLSRQPLFFQHYKQAMKIYEPMVEEGKIDLQTASRLAKTRASHAMIPQIHNVALRTQFAVAARNFFPFYFAQEQAAKRYVRLLGDNPQAYRAYQLIQQGINNPGFISTDGQGGKSVVFPGIGELAGGVINAASAIGIPVVGHLPVTVTGNTQSLKTVLPEATMPGISPFLSIGLNDLASLFPQLKRPVKTITGQGFNSSVIDSLIPSSPARAWFKALNANEQDATFHSAMLSAMAAANYHDQLPGPNASPAEQQAFLDRIKNNARSILVIKGLLGTVSPLAPNASQEDPGLRDEFSKLLQDKDYPTALHDFLGAHGNKAISYTVARSEGTIRGANVPYTNEAMNWIQNNEAIIKGPNAVGAAFLVPQSNSGAGDKQAIYNELLALGLRAAKTPEEFRNTIYVASGNNDYYNAKALHDEAIKGFGDDTTSVKAEDAHWNDFVNGMRISNPIWFNDFRSQEKSTIATQAINDLNIMFANKTAPKGKQTDLVMSLLADYKAHTQARTTIQGYNGNVTLTEEDANWSSYLNNLVKKQPELSTIVNAVFRRLP